MEIIELAAQRNITIPQMIEEGTVYLQASPDLTERNRQLLGRYFSGFEVKGQMKSLQEATTYAQEGGKVIITGNHINQLDAIARRMALESAGFGELIDQATYPCELDWFENPATTGWMGGDHTVKVATAFDIERAKQAKASATPGSDIEKTLSEYLQNCENLNSAARLEMGRHHVLAIYPESGFQFDGRMIRAPKAVSGFFDPRNEIYVLPILTIGQENLPTNSNLDSAPPVPITAIIGDLYLTKTLWANRSKEVTPVDYVMASLAKLDPTFTQENPRYIHPEVLEFYRKIIKGE